LGHSHFTAQGQIVRIAETGADSSPPLSKGHDISLDVNVDRGRVEDFLRLATHSTVPILTGAVTAKSTLHVPPGSAHVVDRLQLNGSFTLGDAVFTNASQDVKRTDVEGVDRKVDSRMQGDFKMDAGVITLPDLRYTVPGTMIQLKGTYGVEGGALDFAGTARMQATVSQMLGGWKGLLLKPADRFFKKDGAGTEVPIHVSGTREDPKFGVDFGRMKATSPETPGWK
jgi:autotransporter translocation and assembly factor TamB